MASSETRRVFPTPGSPATITRRPWPRIAASKCRRSWALSGWRPTKRVTRGLTASCAQRGELETKTPANEKACHLRDQHVAAGGLRCDARGQVDIAAEEVTTLSDRLARMHAGAHF